MSLTNNELNETPWLGLRFQVSFTADGHPSPRPVDAATTPAGQQWAEQVTDALNAHGLTAERYQDEGEDAASEPVEYDEVSVAVGQGYMALAFFAHEIFWTADIFDDQCPQDVADAAVRDIAAIVTAVTGCQPCPDTVGPYEQRLLAPQ